MTPMRFALIAHPAGHTMSPFLQARLFALAGADAEYLAEDVPPQELSAAVNRLRAADGFNVTIPYKNAVIPLLDEVSPDAAGAGSVNTVKCEGGRLRGFSTDGEGFRRALEAAGCGAGGKTAVLGAGGAARAIVFEAARAGGEVTVAAARRHSEDAALSLAEDVRRHVPGARVSACPAPELCGSFDLLVNATPVGMYPETAGCPAEEELVRRAGCVFDAVYNPCETQFLTLARRLGKTAVGGAGMLVRQAAASQEIWFGAHFAESDLRALTAETELETRKRFGSVVLFGFMGSGKTTCGRLLAARLGRRFLDLDELISSREGMTVAEIFAKKGEPAFREMERQAAEELSHVCGLVIAAGGGTLLARENAAAFRRNGVSVLLEVPPETVRARLAGETGSRPMLREPGSLERLYAARRDLYRAAADFRVDADASPEETAERILAVLRPAD